MSNGGYDTFRLLAIYLSIATHIFSYLHTKYFELEYWCGVALWLLLLKFSIWLVWHAPHAQRMMIHGDRRHSTSNEFRSYFLVHQIQTNFRLWLKTLTYDEWGIKPELVFYFIISVSVARFNVFNTSAFVACTQHSTHTHLQWSTKFISFLSSS